MNTTSSQSIFFFFLLCSTLFTWYQSDEQYHIPALYSVFFLLCFFIISDENLATNITPPSSYPQSSIPIKIDPYAIHHSDSPSIILVTPLLTGGNYGSWSRIVTMALRAKSKLGFVDGSLPIPKERNDISN